MRRLFLLLLVITGFKATAQQGLSADSVFFNNQKQAYNQWLEYSGLGQYLYVHGWFTDNDDRRAVINIGFKCHPDSVDAVWEQVSYDFEQEYGYKLYQRLFYRYTEIFELDPNQAAVELYDTYDDTKKPQFYIGIWFENGSVNYEQPILKAQTVNIKIPSFRLPNGYKGNVGQSDAMLTKAYVFETLRNYLKERYERKEGAEVSVLEEGTLLRLKVGNVIKEVLYDQEDESRIVNVLQSMGLDVSSAKRELLYFTIAYIPQDQGFRLACTVDGRFSDKLYAPRESDYIDMDLESSFRGYLYRYAVNMRGEIFQCLSMTQKN